MRAPAPEHVAYVASLPRRTAHALYALVYLPKLEPHNPYGPYTAREVQLYDSEAITARQTAAGLRDGQQRGLCVCVPGRGLWVATNAAHELGRALEARYLADTYGDA